MDPLNVNYKYSSAFPRSGMKQRRLVARGLGECGPRQNPRKAHWLHRQCTGSIGNALAALLKQRGSFFEGSDQTQVPSQQLLFVQHRARLLCGQDECK